MKVRLRPGDRAILEARLRAGSTEQRQLLRIRIVLEAADARDTGDRPRTGDDADHGQLVAYPLRARRP